MDIDQITTENIETVRDLIVRLQEELDDEYGDKRMMKKLDMYNNDEERKADEKIKKVALNRER